MNFGPHALYMGGAGRPFLKELGIEPAGNPPPSGRSRAFFQGKTPLLPLSLRTIFETKLLGLFDKFRLLSFMKGLNSINDKDIQSLTVNQWLESDKELSGGGEALKGFIRTLIQLTTYTADMDKLSAQAGIIQLKLAMQTGVIYLHGGWAQMIDALLEKCKEAGVEVLTGCEVTEISRIAETGEISVVFKAPERASGRKTYRGIILAAPPDVVKKILSVHTPEPGHVSLNLGA